MITFPALFKTHIGGAPTPNLNDITSGDSGGTGFKCSFSPDQAFIAVSGASTNKQIAIWSWNGSTTIAEVETVAIGSSSATNSWHPGGNFLAVSVGNATGSIRVYSWNGVDTLAEVESIDLTAGECVDWHPSGNFLAAATDNTSKEIAIYSWNGADTLTEVETVNLTTYGFGVKWSPDGNYLLATSYDATKSIIVYSWNGSDTLTEIDYASIAVGYSNYGVWMSDNSYIFTANGTTPLDKALKVYAFNGSALTLKDTVNTGANSRALDIYNDKYIITGTGKVLKLYEFNTVTETLGEIDSLTYASSTSVAWPTFNSAGTYLAVGMYIESGVTIRIVAMY